MTLLEAKNLGRRSNNRFLWRGLSFKLESGSCLGLVGPSGCGKTLLMRSLAALDPLEQGQVVFEHRSLQQWQLPQYRAKVMYLPQRPAVFEGTVEANLKTVFRLAVHHHRHFQPSRVLNILEALGRTPEFLNLSAEHLSGGESQILALVRTLQLEPQVLLLDEPTASLDADTTHKVESLLANWQQEQPGRAYVWTSHDSQQIQRVARETLTLSDYAHS